VHFLASLNRPICLDILIFFETRTQYKVTGKNQKNRTLLRVSTTRSKKGSFERLFRGLKKEISTKMSIFHIF
jgi:hypothetical protein